MEAGRLIRPAIAIWGATTLMIGCAPRYEVGPSVEGVAPGVLVARGNYQGAAQAYARRAQQAPPDKSPALYLEQARALAIAGADHQAVAVLDRLAGTSVAGRAYVLRARLQLRRHKIRQAIATLEYLLHSGGTTSLTPNLHIAALDYLAQARLHQGNPGAAFDALVQRHSLLSGPAARKVNAARLRSLLEALPESGLRARLKVAGSGFPAGYIRLELRRRGATEQSPETVRASLREWLAEHRNHLLAPAVRHRLQKAREATLNLGLMLPLRSRYGRLAEAIQRGVLASYYLGPGPSPVRIYILDTQGTAEGARKALEKARSHGCDALIGPLNRPAVRALTREVSGSRPAVPLLLLNTSREWSQGDPRLFQFGLDPKEEARQAAEYAYSRGYHHAAILFPETDWGRNLAAHFQRRWLELGGLTGAMGGFQPDGKDHSEAIKRLLGLDNVTYRRQKLSRDLGLELHENHTPPRHRDLGFLFLVAHPVNARLIKPQLRFYAAGDLPVVGTSHIYRAAEDRSDRYDLDGIQFLLSPWFLEPTPPQRQARRSLITNYPGQASGLSRLNALGFDAYKFIVRAWQYSLLMGRALSPALQEVRLEGATGDLRVDPDGRIRRRLHWAIYRRGRVRATGADRGWIRDRGPNALSTPGR